MNWKNEAIEHLSRYAAMSRAVENIPKEIKILEQAAVELKGTRPDQVHVAGYSGPRDDAIIGNLIKREELNRSLEMAQLWVESTKAALSVLSPEEKLVLQRMYVNPEKGVLNRLSSELGIEQSSIYRKRDHALYRFTMALYGAS
jgi:DNA-directed RNA polymerase specialized sigma subunit